MNLPAIQPSTKMDFIFTEIPSRRLSMVRRINYIAFRSAFICYNLWWEEGGWSQVEEETLPIFHA
jgi:hypothetical protein